MISYFDTNRIEKAGDNSQ